MYCVIIKEEIVGTFESIEHAKEWIDSYFIETITPDLIIKEIKEIPIPLMNYFKYQGKIK